MFLFSALRSLLVALALLQSFVLPAQTTPVLPAPTVLRLGVAPHTSARVILEMYQPLRLHLERSLGLPVEVITAPDFTEFARRMLHQDYDIAITTGHQARLAQTDAAYVPLVTYSADFRAVALVADNGTVNSTQDLRGKPVLGLSPTSLVTLWGQHWLKNNGVQSPLRYVSASDSVARIVLSGEAIAGFISLANYQSLPRDLQTKMRFLVISEPLAGRVYMLNQRQLAHKSKIDAVLTDFAASPAGQSYFAKYKLDGYRLLKARELKSMDLYAAEVRQSLQ